MKKKGFTLVELLGVLSILAAILLISIPSITGLLKRQKESTYQQFLNDLYLATEAYVQGNSSYDLSSPNQKVYVKIEDVVRAKYFKSTTVNPKTNEKVNLQHYVQIIVRDDHTFHYEYVTEAMEYAEVILNGADPVLKEGLVPVTITSSGVVRKADTNKQWYSYANKEWANAVILKNESTIYKVGDVIPEDNIESYFVWIPKYSYQLWDLGDYNNITGVDNTKIHIIPVRFGIENTSDSVNGQCTTPGIAGKSGNCKVGDYMTHPAFLAFNTNGLWVGKFETGYDGATSTANAQVNSADASKVIIKPNVYSWRGITLGNAFKTSYEYKRSLESHMMKNTEWGAVAYLQHSQYGSAKSVRVNNNRAYITGYAAVEEPTKGYSATSIEGNRYEGTTLNTNGTYTLNYQNIASIVASTTGNITGIYDMSGGSQEYVVGYTSESTMIGGVSGITGIYSDFFTNSSWNSYYDAYTSTSITQYNNRILGDATGELGPYYKDNDTNVSSWYKNYASFAYSLHPWFVRSGNNTNGTQAGMYYFHRHTGDGHGAISFRLVLAP